MYMKVATPSLALLDHCWRREATHPAQGVIWQFDKIWSQWGHRQIWPWSQYNCFEVNQSWGGGGMRLGSDLVLMTPTEQDFQDFLDLPSKIWIYKINLIICYVFIWFSAAFLCLLGKSNYSWYLTFCWRHLHNRIFMIYLVKLKTRQWTQLFCKFLSDVVLYFNFC